MLGSRRTRTWSSTPTRATTTTAPTPSWCALLANISSTQTAKFPSVQTETGVYKGFYHGLQAAHLHASLLLQPRSRLHLLLRPTAAVGLSLTAPNLLTPCCSCPPPLATPGVRAFSHRGGLRPCRVLRPPGKLLFLLLLHPAMPNALRWWLCMLCLPACLRLPHPAHMMWAPSPRRSPLVAPGGGPPPPARPRALTPACMLRPVCLLQADSTETGIPGLAVKDLGPYYAY